MKSLERTRQEIREFKQLIARRDALRPNGHTLEAEVEALHGQLARAFGLAAGAIPERAAARGEPIAARAREAMLEEVLLPYNRLFGQYKRHDSLLALGARARARFTASLREEPALPASGQAAVDAVFDAYLDALERARAACLERLEGDSRGVFLPFQLVLRPEQHDTQAEIDAIIERAVGDRFTTGNRAVYASGQQFQHELARMVRETEDYHVLWVHDLCGVAENGRDPDEVSFTLAADGYLAALSERIRAFDRTGRLPVFMILVDLPYYESKKGRRVADLLEDPLGHRVDFPSGFEELRRRVDRAQEELRRAVAGSRRLQEEAARRGPAWLRRVIKVHVSVTNPADFSYRTRRLVGYLPFAPDNAIRDHRKIAFRDVTEADPGKGEALFTGVSVGEQYASPTWEDRALLATGPAILQAKEAARRYLRANGFRQHEIPPPLRALPMPPDYDDKVRALEAAGATARALQVHNHRGFAPKDASLVNAILYTLSPPGSLIIVPNPIWTSMEWAGQLVGAALRGCHVYVIAPSKRNAPSASFLALSRSREVLSRLLEIERMLAPELESAGGRLKTGLYDRRADVFDTAGRLREVAEGYGRYAFLRDEFPLPDATYDLLDRAPDLLAASGAAPSLLPDSVRQEPKLHRKTQIIGTREALLALAEQPATHELLRAQLAGQVGADPEGLAIPGREPLALLAPLVEAHRSLPQEVRERSVYYLTVGSLNKDARGMMLDGEVLYVLSSEWSLWAYTDFFFLLGSTTWLESQQQFDALLPPYSQLERRLGRWFRKAI
jgi:phosphatidylserine/phosphatidylglycerophosphate/cardiolipin synthase-like enzyme